MVLEPHAASVDDWRWLVRRTEHRMNNVIESFDLSKSFGDVLAVDQLSLHVGKGEIYAFLGLNGAGKTTTIRMLLGLVRPTGGVVHMLGMRIRPDGGPWSRVGYLVEAPSAYPELTVRENLEVARRLRGCKDALAVDRIIEQLALSPYADRRARTLSQGNAQRLGLAKALFHEPDLLILDEPANGLDPAGVVEVREILRELCRDRGVTVFMSSHILAEVSRLATRIGVIHKGRLVEELDADELERRRHRRLVVDARDRLAARSTLAAVGWGAFFPWSVPALYSGLAGTQIDQLSAASYMVVILTSLAGLAATLAWWRFADQAM
jgi:ABC-2 type transport system ATP-binding protein